MFQIITQTDIGKYSSKELHALLKAAQSEFFNLPIGSLRYKIAGENIRMLQMAISSKQPKVKYQPKPPSPF